MAPHPGRALLLLASLCLACTQAVDVELPDAAAGGGTEEGATAGDDASLGPAAPAREAAEPFLPDRQAVSRKLSELAERLDRSCTATQHCALQMLYASCVDTCLAVAVVGSVAVTAEQALSVIEEVDCRTPATNRWHSGAECTAWDQRGVCREGRCEVAPICNEGCVLDRYDSVCRNAEGRRCDRCPNDQEPVDEAPCTELGLECRYGPACGARTATCERNEAGELRWFVITNLC